MHEVTLRGYEYKTRGLMGGLRQHLTLCRHSAILSRLLVGCPPPA
jgi:hypothetical protein